MPETTNFVLPDDRVFCWARPRQRDWSEYDHTTMEQGRGLRPVMLRGMRIQTLYVPGSQYGYNPADFELHGVLEAPTFPDEARNVP